MSIDAAQGRKRDSFGRLNELLTHGSMSPICGVHHRYVYNRLGGKHPQARFVDFFCGLLSSLALKYPARLVWFAHTCWLWFCVHPDLNSHVAALVSNRSWYPPTPETSVVASWLEMNNEGFVSEITG